LQDGAGTDHSVTSSPPRQKRRENSGSRRSKPRSAGQEPSGTDRYLASWLPSHFARWCWDRPQPHLIVYPDPPTSGKGPPRHNKKIVT